MLLPHCGLGHCMCMRPPAIHSRVPGCRSHDSGAQCLNGDTMHPSCTPAHLQHAEQLCACAASALLGDAHCKLSGKTDNPWCADRGHTRAATVGSPHGAWLRLRAWTMRMQACASSPCWATHTAMGHQPSCFVGHPFLVLFHGLSKTQEEGGARSLASVCGPARLRTHHPGLWIWSAVGMRSAVLLSGNRA